MAEYDHGEESSPYCPDCGLVLEECICHKGSLVDDDFDDEDNFDDGQE